MSIVALLLGITIALQPDARVRGGEIELSEIASIGGATREQEALLGAVSLGGAPSPGFTRTLLRERISIDVQQALPTVAITWSGSVAVRVAPESETLASTALEACASTALRELFRSRDAEIRLESAPQDLVVPVASQSRELRAILGTREPRSGSWSVGVQVWIDGEPYRAAWATYHVDLFERRSVLARDVRRGEAISAADLTQTRVRVEGNEPLLDPAAIVGGAASRDLVRGSALGERDVVRQKLVKSGDLVELSIRKGSVAARVAAYAVQDGRAGERIRIATSDRRRELVATVVGRGVVEVDLGGARESATQAR